MNLPTSPRIPRWLARPGFYIALLMVTGIALIAIGQVTEPPEPRQSHHTGVIQSITRGPANSWTIHAAADDGQPAELHVSSYSLQGPTIAFWRLEGTGHQAQITKFQAPPSAGQTSETLQLSAAGCLFLVLVVSIVSLAIAIRRRDPRYWWYAAGLARLN